MQKPSIPKLPIRVTPRAISVFLLLVVLHLAVWLLRDRILDGQKIATILTVATATNLLLFMLLKTRIPPLARLAVQATFLYHALFFLLFLAEQRKI